MKWLLVTFAVVCSETVDYGSDLAEEDWATLFSGFHDTKLDAHANFGTRQGDRFELIEDAAEEPFGGFEEPFDKDDIAFFKQESSVSRGDETKCISEDERNKAAMISPDWHEFTDHIYILGSNKARRKHMHAMLTLELEVPEGKITYYDGFDCRQWPPTAEFKEKFLQFAPTTMEEAISPDHPDQACKRSFLGINSTARNGCAEICCSLGHFGIAKEMLENNYQSVLVLEDDACATENLFSERMSGALAKIKQLDTWNFIKLGDCFRVSAGAHASWFQQRHKEGTLFEQLVPGPYFKHSYCTHAFAMSRHGAKALLDKAFPIEVAVDDYLLWLIKHDPTSYVIGRYSMCGIHYAGSAAYMLLSAEHKRRTECA
jgi:GR25 family glycosyltransferase involved in LPS biosynthesis